MTRRFVEALAAATNSSAVKAVYPDAGVAAMLAHNWAGDSRSFAIDSLNARRPVSAEDDLIVICCPDPFTAEECQRTVRQVTEADEKAGVMERPVVLFNQRLSRCAQAGEGGAGGCWGWFRGRQQRSVNAGQGASHALHMSMQTRSHQVSCGRFCWCTDTPPQPQPPPLSHTHTRARTHTHFTTHTAVMWAWA
jgi:hypothetical protein